MPRTQPEIKYVDVTPELAQQFLSKMRIQRKAKTWIIQSYANDMSAGRWTLGESAICFNEQGELVNGQHRMRAVILSGCTITFAVMIGIDEQSILHMDSGTGRTTSDQLQILEQPNSNYAAPLARTVLMYEAVPDKVWTSHYKAAATSAAQVDFVRKNSSLVQESIETVRPMSKWRINRTAAGALYFLTRTSSSSDDRWDDFADGVISGANLRSKDPRIALNSYYARTDLRPWGGVQSHLLVMIRVWNKYILNEDLIRVQTPKRTDLPMPKVL